MASKMLCTGIAALAAFMAIGVDARHPSDTITWGYDNSRMGYFPNANMDPAVVTSADFGQVFKVALPGNFMGEKERIFSQPLIYTPAGGDGTQFVYYATAQNNVYKMNAKTGQILAQTNLHIPFLSAELTSETGEGNGYCQDINPVVGIIGTGVIDPDTDTLYLTAKTYKDQSKPGVIQGRPAGRIYVHALSIHDLSERPNFPLDLEGIEPRNNPGRLFNGGIQNQRPGLLHPVGSDYIYAGFGSHCVNYNFTGWVIGWHKTTGEIVERWATQGDGVPTQKGASLWMSGGGMASDDKGSMFFATGNGYSEQVKDIPINRGSPPTSLEEAAVHLTYDGTGKTSVVDFFMPENKGFLDGGDLDLGTSPLQMLPSDPFSCGDTKRIGVVTGKDRNTFFLDLDDLGGYRTGPNRGNRVIGQYYNKNSVYSGAGVLPLDGGYVYINVIGFESVVFKFNCVGGKAAFTQVATTDLAGKSGFGVGHGATTSLQGQAGTGLFWVSDVNNNNPQGHHFRVYESVPTGNDGKILKLVKSFNVPAINKFSRPQFGNGIVYLGTNDGTAYAFGAPTTPALNCTTDGNFGSVAVGVNATTKTISCKAKIGVSITNLTISSTEFSVADVGDLPRTVATDGTFSFKANFKPSRVGARSTNIAITTKNTAGGFASASSVRLSGTGFSDNALLHIEPSSITFNQAVLDSAVTSNSLVVANEGNSTMTVQSVKFSEEGPDGPFITGTVSGNETKVGLFSIDNLPTTLAADSQTLVNVHFNPSAIGSFKLWAIIETSGGQGVISLTASVGASPKALIQLETPDGSGWQTWTTGAAPLSFGNVTQNTALRLRFRLSNVAPAGSVALNVPISKGPFGIPNLINLQNQADIGEGTIIQPGEYAEAFITCTVPKAQWNSNSYSNSTSWTFNTNDISMGKFDVPFTCTAFIQQGGPLNEDGSGKYRYVGCFRENNPGRQLQTQLYGDDNNTPEMCMDACSARGFAYCGTQYHRECWGGPAPPVQQSPEGNCNYDCSGDLYQYCGGNGVGEGAGPAYISLWATNATAIPSNPAPGGPFVNPGTNGYKSIGCYNEVDGRALEKAVDSGDVRNVATCINACKPLGYKYVGVQYGSECWCGNTLRGGSTVQPIGDCSVTCRDNSTEYCGGGQRLNMYQLETTINTSSLPVSLSTSATATASGSATSVSAVTTTATSATPTSTTPAIKDKIGAYRYQGCYVSNNQGGRSLQGKNFYDDPMTLEKCAAACSEYTWWGVEYGRECYCDNQLRGNTAPDLTNSTCNFLCPGDSLTWCGAGNRLTMYKYDASLNSTALSSSASGAGSSTTVIVSGTSSTSASSSSSVVTVSSSVVSSSAVSSSIVSSSASSSSAVSSSAVSSSVVSSSAVSSSVVSSSAVSSSVVSSSAASSSVVSSSVVSSSTVVSTTVVSTSISTTASPTSTIVSTTSTTIVSTTTPSTTSVASSSAPSSAPSSSTVISSSVISSSSVATTSSSASTSAVSSSAPTTSSAITSSAPPTTSSSSSAVSSSTSASTSAPPTSSSTSAAVTSATSTSASTASASRSATSTSTAPGTIVTPLYAGNTNFTYYGCVQGPSNGRLVPKQVLSSNEMTHNMCLEACWMYQYAGIEYGRECWCGNGPINWAGNAGATPGKNVTDSECKLPCSGNATATCGERKKMTFFYFDVEKARKNSQ